MTLCYFISFTLLIYKILISNLYRLEQKNNAFIEQHNLMYSTTANKSLSMQNITG